MKLPSLVLLVLLALPGCSTGPTEQLAALNRARDRWAEQNIPAYAFTIRRACFCAGPLNIEVQVNQTVVTRTDLDTGLPVDPQFAGLAPDIPGLFQMIETEIRRPPAALEAVYHPGLGYPTSFSVDRIRDAIDDEFGFTLTAFRTLP